MLFCDTISIHSVTLGAMLHVQLMFFRNKFYNFVKVFIDCQLGPPLTLLYCLPFIAKFHLALNSCKIFCKKVNSK